MDPHYIPLIFLVQLFVMISQHQSWKSIHSNHKSECRSNCDTAVEQRRRRRRSSWGLISTNLNLNISYIHNGWMIQDNLIFTPLNHIITLDQFEGQGLIKGNRSLIQPAIIVTMTHPVPVHEMGYHSLMHHNYGCCIMCFISS